MESFSHRARRGMKWDQLEEEESKEKEEEKKNATSYSHLLIAERRGNCNDDY